MIARVRDALRLSGVLVTALVTRRAVRARGDEADRRMPGDELVAETKIRWQHAVTVRARPAEIWPWLVQMGCRRGGWYSYDGLDNGCRPSAERIVPELQEVGVGDIFPMSPKARDTFVVRLVEPESALVLGDAAGGMVWELVLDPIDADSTRLIARIRATYDSAAFGLLLRTLWHATHFAMQRRQLLNLKDRVEAAR